MHRFKRHVCVAILLAWSAATVAALPTEFGDGWHTWQVDTGSEYNIYVLFDDNIPTRIRTTQGRYFGKPKGPIIDHGIVAAAVNYRWFRGIVERNNLDRDIRASALFGLAQSDSDEAYAYLDSLIMME